MIWTDTALYQMQFIGAPLTFGFKQIGSNCGAVGINAAVDVSGNSYWMSNDSFFVYDGAVKKIPCSVQDYVFDDINENAKQDVFVHLILTTTKLCGSMHLLTQIK